MGIFDGIFTPKQTDNIFDPSAFSAYIGKRGHRAYEDGTVKAGTSTDGFMSGMYFHTSTFHEDERAAHEKAIEYAEKSIETLEKRIEEHRAWLKSHPAKAQFALGDKVALVKDCPDKMRGLIGEVASLSLDSRGGVTVRVRWPEGRGMGFYPQSRLLGFGKTGPATVDAEATAAPAPAKPAEEPAKPSFKVGDRVRIVDKDDIEFHGCWGIVDEVDEDDRILPYHVKVYHMGDEWYGTHELTPRDAERSEDREWDRQHGRKSR